MYNEKTIEKLKQKILDLAIRGKLVPQDPNDEPASVLIEKIRKEKEKLIKEGKIKKPKEESFIFKGSDNCYYENVKIKTLINIISTLNKEVKVKDVLNNGKYPVISQSKDNIDGYFNDETKLIIDLPIILFGDHTRIVKFITSPFIPGADGTKLFKANCYPKYLFYLIKYASSLIENRGYGRHFAYLKNCEVPYFSNVDKQIEIVVSLDFYYEYIDNFSYQYKRINSLKDSIRFKILDLFFSPNSSYKSYYENDFNLGDILEYEQPAPYIVENTDYNDNFDTPVLTPGKTFILGYTDEKDGIYKADKDNKVIIFDDFTTASRMVDFDFKVKSSAMKILHISDTSKFDIDYMFYLLQTINIIVDTHKRFWISEYAPLKVKIHSFDEQIKIKNRITSIFNIIDNL